MVYVTHTETLDTGGGCMVDVVHLHGGGCIVISADCLVFYFNGIKDFFEHMNGADVAHLIIQ